jgi:hypothetical protein
MIILIIIFSRQDTQAQLQVAQAVGGADGALSSSSIVVVAE